MLKGDLSTSTVATVLRELSEGGATGCLHVLDPVGQTAKAYLRGGRVYAVMVPGRRPQLGARLVSSGALGPEALAEAEQTQRTELQGWRLGELLVHLGYVDQPVVEAFVEEQVRESLSALLPWRNGTWKFRVDERTREDVAPPVAVDELLVSLEERACAWAVIEQTVHGPGAVPVLSAAGTCEQELEVDPDAWSLLCKVDGARTLTDLARACGFTLYEAGRVVHTLVQAGLLQMEAPALAADADPGEQGAGSGPAASAVAGRLIEALSAASCPTDLTARDDRVLIVPAGDEQVDGSLSRASQTLSALLGPSTAGDDLFDTPLHRPPTAAPAAPEDPRRVERARREAVRRERDAEELAAAHAELEATRAAEQQRRDQLLPADHVADVVDLHAVREAARVEAEQEQAAAEQAERAAAEQEQAEQAAEQQRLQEDRAAQASRDAAAELAALTADPDPNPDRAGHAAAFAELSAAASLDVAVRAPEPVTPPAPTPTHEEPAPAYASHDTDTASLMRELSSLGLDDSPSPVLPPRPPAPRPVAAAPRRKKGLFGR